MHSQWIIQVVDEIKSWYKMSTFVNFKVIRAQWKCCHFFSISMSIEFFLKAALQYFPNAKPKFSKKTCSFQNWFQFDRVGMLFYILRWNTITCAFEFFAVSTKMTDMTILSYVKMLSYAKDLIPDTCGQYLNN